MFSTFKVFLHLSKDCFVTWYSVIFYLLDLHLCDIMTCDS